MSLIDTSHIPGFDEFWAETGSRLLPSTTVNREHIRGVCALAWQRGAFEARVREETAKAILKGYSAAIQAVRNCPYPTSAASPRASDQANSRGEAPPSDDENYDGPSDAEMGRYTEQAARIRHNGRRT